MARRPSQGGLISTLRGRQQSVAADQVFRSAPFQSTSDPDAVHSGDAAGGALSGTYPNPSFAADMATQAELDAVAAANAPWTVDISPFSIAATHTNWNTITKDDGAINNGFILSSAAQNDEIGWDVVLAAGTWTLEILTPTFINRGIITASLDGTSVGTMDCYSAGLAYNVRKSITGISVATSGKKRLLLKMATKNGLASSYYGSLSAIALRRTS